MLRPSPELVHVIINPASGRRTPILQQINDYFHKAGIRWKAKVTMGAGDGAVEARKAIKKGADLVISWGGDGTVMDVADGLVGTDLPLLILPGGTGNLVAQEVGMPLSVERCLSLVTREEGFRTRQVDVGKANGQCFLLRVGSGFEADLLQDASRKLKNQIGKWAYVYAATKALQEVQIADYRITLDEEKVVTGAGVACVIANAGSFGLGDLALSPHIDIDDGKLDVIFIRKADVESIISLVRMMMGDEDAEDSSKRIDASGIVSRWAVKKVRVETDPPISVQVDGDVTGKTPIDAEILPNALTVVAP